MTFTNFSQKQLKVLAWWTDKSRWKDCDAIICDGAVRAGKTLSLSLSFVLWAMRRFNGCNFAICGKTVASCRRNVITPLLPVLKNGCGLNVDYKISQSVMEIKCGKVKNRFYIFGGKDESSAALIQGVTLAGILFDEVALMPQSFVEQGLARCSVNGSKFWFNCNPENPHHWFYTEWIRKQKSKNAYYLHFTMEDNPSLSPSVLERYKKLYSGIFYERYVLGKWIAAHGLIYPMFNQEFHVVPAIPRPYERYQVSIDYGTMNPCSMGLWGLAGGVWYRIKEFYYSGREKGVLLTDDEYYDKLVELIGDLPVERIIVDPSAASFIAVVRRKGKFATIPAVNNVQDGIRNVSACLRNGAVKFNECCKASIKEFALYKWDEDAQEDTPIKENDHAMDEIRYFVMTNKIALPKYKFF